MSMFTVLFIVSLETCRRLGLWLTVAHRPLYIREHLWAPAPARRSRVLHDIAMSRYPQLRTRRVRDAIDSVNEQASQLPT